MPVTVRIRTGIPDELGGEDVAFVNVFERPERPGGPSVILVHAETHTVLAAGDSFAIGDRRYRLDAIEEQGDGYVVTVTVFEPAPAPEPLQARKSQVYEIAPVPARKLVSLLKASTLAILARLAGGGAVAAIAEWATESRDTMSIQWNGEQLGPSTSTRSAARFEDPSTPAEATIGIEDIRYEPSAIARQEVSAFWRAGRARVHVFLRSEEGAPMEKVYSKPEDGWIVALIAEATGKWPA